MFPFDFNILPEAQTFQIVNLQPEILTNWNKNNRNCTIDV